MDGSLDHLAVQVENLVKLLSFEETLESYLQSPTPARFAALREMIVDGAEYRPQADVIGELSELLRRRRFELLLQRVDELMPAWALCPRVHFLAGCAAEEIGDLEEVELRRFLTSSCIQGIRGSGDGGRRRPWPATYPSDVRDALASLGLNAQSQHLVEADETLLDVVATDDGSIYWFDVGEMIAAGGELAAAAVASRD